MKTILCYGSIFAEHIMMILLLPLVTMTFTCHAEELTIGFGMDKPPFVFGQEKRGLEIDIVREALQYKGHTFTIRHLSNNRLQCALLTMEDIDGVATVRATDDSLFYSKNFITFENFAISKKKVGIVLHKVSDLKGLHFAIWQNAWRDLGPEFEALYSPDSPDREGYHEVSSQEGQNEMFWKERVAVIIVDKTIFEWYRKQFAGKYDTSLEVVYHDIFQEKTHFQVAFKEQKLRDEFNEGLRYIRETGIYQQLVDKYIK